MIKWFDDLTLGMRFKNGEVSVTKEDIKRFAGKSPPVCEHFFNALYGDVQVVRPERFELPTF